MVFAGTHATFTNNVIRGEGVAGIRVAGTVRAVNNEFRGLSLRKGGPPNFAVWALNGSSVTMSDNVISNWRHALHASEAETTISENRISDFHQVAIVISKPSRPPVIIGNTVVSSDPKARIATIDGKPAGAADNQLDRPSTTELTR